MYIFYTFIEYGKKEFKEDIIIETPFPPYFATGKEEEENYGDDRNIGDGITEFLPILYYRINKLNILGFKEEFKRSGVKTECKHFQLKTLLEK